MSLGRFSSPSPDPVDSPADDRAALSWTALHEAAAGVAELAGFDAEVGKFEPGDFLAAILATAGWRRTLIEQGIEDLTAIMAPGIAALLAVHARGGSSMAAAQALWHEFVQARSALLALATPICSDTEGEP